MEFTVKLTTEQIIDFIQQIPAEQIKYGEAKVRKICAARGLDWDAMSEEERIDFINDLVHEDRECNR